ncbi:hypothetical protein F4780DRAFT_779504 [Xylariomycetidae sp. FL0641]|nr:hypothetical protein F4780DRAFT_779504 [Xylariomycetidae sp. FL0641]
MFPIYQTLVVASISSLDNDGFLDLSTQCKPSRGGRRPWVNQVLDLNFCYGTNDKGELVEKDYGHFQGTCGSCGLDGSVMWCKCEVPGGNPIDTSIDTDKLIEVNGANGFIKCFDNVAIEVGVPQHPPSDILGNPAV